MLTYSEYIFKISLLSPLFLIWEWLLIETWIFSFFIMSLWILFQPSVFPGFVWCFSGRRKVVSTLPRDSRGPDFPLCLYHAWPELGEGLHYCWAWMFVLSLTSRGGGLVITELGGSSSLSIKPPLKVSHWGKGGSASPGSLMVSIYTAKGSRSWLEGMKVPTPSLAPWDTTPAVVWGIPLYSPGGSVGSPLVFAGVSMNGVKVFPLFLAGVEWLLRKVFCLDRETFCSVFCCTQCYVWVTGFSTPSLGYLKEK